MRAIEWQPRLFATTTDPVVGSDGALDGQAFDLGGLVLFRFMVRMGTVGVTAGAGFLSIGTPLGADGASLGDGNAAIAGSCTIGVAGAPFHYTGSWHIGTITNGSDPTRMRPVLPGLLATQISDLAGFGAGASVHGVGWFSTIGSVFV